MRIAILGAGGAGVCSALELASRGYGVDLYEQHPRPLEGASRYNEGKVHLGLVYAKDRTLATARVMMEGALGFHQYLRRWIDVDVMAALVSTPFYYGVHRDSMASLDELEAHYAACQRLFTEMQAASGQLYLGLDKLIDVQRVPTPQAEQLVNPEFFQALYRTSELAVDVRAVADRLTDAVLAEPRIRFIPSATITGVASADDGLRVQFQKQGATYTETYDCVANTLWEGRLAVDATFGLKPERPWIHRYKMGGWLAAAAAGVPSLTMVLGRYGDLVNLGPRGLYFCWYPDGMLGASHELRPPDMGMQLPEERRRGLLRSSFETLSTLCPPLASVPYHDGLVQAAGGAIFAWGETDIDQQASHLHTRYEIGIYSRGNYHSVNTGKYTLIPLLGYRTAERILGIA